MKKTFLHHVDQLLRDPKAPSYVLNVTDLQEKLTDPRLKSSTSKVIQGKLRKIFRVQKAKLQADVYSPVANIPNIDFRSTNTLSCCQARCMPGSSMTAKVFCGPIRSYCNELFGTTSVHAVARASIFVSSVESCCSLVLIHLDPY